MFTIVKTFHPQVRRAKKGKYKRRLLENRRYG